MPMRCGSAGGPAAGRSRPARSSATSTARLEHEHRVHAFLRPLRHADDRRLLHAGEALSTRSTSSGNTLSPSGVTIISFLRPLMNTRPCSSRSPMSPVCSHPSASIGLASGWDSGVAGWALRVVPGRHVLAPHQDLAVVGDADLDAGDRGPNRSLARLERMIQRDDRRGFGEAVSLDHRETHAPPELFELGRQRRRADDERPELQTKRPVHAAVAPPAAGDRDARPAAARGFRERAHDVFAQHVEDLRHAHEHRHAPRLDQPDDVVRIEAAREDHRAAHHRRHGGRHRLAEHVAERQQVHEPQRMKRLAVVPVLDRSRRSTGTMFARTLRCRMTTPFGSAVAPEVKMIWMMSSRVMRDGGHRAVRAPVEVGETPRSANRSWSGCLRLLATFGGRHRRAAPAARRRGRAPARRSPATSGSRSGRR